MKEDYYQVEEIIGKQIKKGKVFYFVKWKGYSIDQSTWEQEQNLANCRELVEAYELQLSDKKGKNNEQLLQKIRKDQSIPEYYKTLMKKNKDIKSRRKKRQKVEDSSLEIEEIIEEKIKPKPKKKSKDISKQKEKLKYNEQQDEIIQESYSQFYNTTSNKKVQVTNKIENIRIDKVIIQDTLPYFQAYDMNLNKEIGFLTYDFMVKNYPNTLKSLTVKQLQLNSLNN